MDETDRWLRNTAILVGFLLPLLLFFPTSCWADECEGSSVDCMGSGCDSLLGVTMHDPGKMAWLAIISAILGAAILGTTAHVFLRKRTRGRPGATR